MVQAYNDWHIDGWCGAYPGPLHPDGAAGAVGSRAVRGRDPARRGEGLPLADVHREPGDARAAELPRRALGPDVARARRRGHDPQRPPRFVGPARGHRARRADRRDDHAAADEHLPGRGRPRVVARVQGVPRRCASRSPRAAPAGSRTSSTGSTAPTTCTTSGPARTSATALPSDVFREHILTCFIADPIGLAAPRRHRHRQHLLGAGLPALRLVVAERARGARARGRAVRRARRRARQDHARERDALVPLRSVRAPPTRAVHRRRAARRGRRPRRVDPRDGQGPIRGHADA